MYQICCLFLCKTGFVQTVDAAAPQMGHIPFIHYELKYVCAFLNEIEKENRTNEI